MIGNATCFGLRNRDDGNNHNKKPITIHKCANTNQKSQIKQVRLTRPRDHRHRPRSVPAASLYENSCERSTALMAYVITDSCIKDELCVEVCPVDCIHPKKDEPQFKETTQLY